MFIEYHDTVALKKVSNIINSEIENYKAIKKRKLFSTCKEMEILSVLHRIQLQVHIAIMEQETKELANFVEAGKRAMEKVKRQEEAPV